MSPLRSLALVLLGTLVLPTARTAPAQVAAVRIRSVQLARQGAVTIVIVEASGPLPAPQVGQVDGPPRVFFDFAGVVPATRGAASPGDAVLRGVRVALNSAKPLITRVVIDLVKPETFRIDADHIGAGRLRVIVGEGPAPAPSAETRTAPVPAPLPMPAPTVAPPPAPAPTSGPAPSPSPPPPPVRTTASPPVSGAPAAAAASPTRELDRYLAQIADPLERLLALRSLLATIDQFASPSPDELQMSAEEFDRIRRVVSLVKPPPALQPTHDLLMRACALGTMAARLRAEANRTSDIGQVRNAGSAAAGARLLLERACTDLGCESK